MIEVFYIDVNRARLMANVLERSFRLFEDGYRAVRIADTTVQITNPRDVVYTLDVQDCTCCCPFFVGHEGRLPCKHLLGWEKLLEDQSEAAGGDPFAECKFSLGRLLMTPGAQAAFLAAGQSPLSFLLRHSQGDWGDVDAADKRANDRDLRDGGRLLSSYHLQDGTKLWLITEADRSSSTFLLPEEY